MSDRFTTTNTSIPMTLPATEHDTCKEGVWDGWHSHRCYRKAWKDGYCKQHHPDSVKARQKESQRKWEERQAKDPLRIALNRIKELESRIRELEGILEELYEMKAGVTL
jgi:hypothetical protein